jgi:hypothetical protein
MSKAILFTADECKGCPRARKLLEEMDVKYEEHKMEDEDGYYPLCWLYDVNCWPTLVLVYDDNGVAQEYVKIEGFRPKKMPEEIKKWRKECQSV